MMRLPQLDILRAIAVLLVIWNHYPFLRVIGVGTWVGVDLFFVLSGFLISGLLFQDLLNTGSVNLARFYIRRAFKIYPAFYFFLAVLWLMSPAVRHLSYWSEIFFLQNYFPGVWGHTWSLAIEEHFYLILPVIILLLSRFRAIHIIPKLGLCLSISCLVLRTVYCVRGEYESVPFMTHTRIDALFLGVVLGYYFNYQPERFSRWRSHWLPLCGLILLLPPFLLVNHPRWLFSVGLTTNSLGFSCFLLWCINQQQFRLRFLEDTGRHSYSIYLWHLPIVLIFRTMLPASALMFAVTVALCVVIGVVMAHAIEFPTLELRNKAFPQHSRNSTKERKSLAVAQ